MCNCAVMFWLQHFNPLILQLGSPTTQGHPAIVLEGPKPQGDHCASSWTNIFIWWIVFRNVAFE